MLPSSEISYEQFQGPKPVAISRRYRFFFLIACFFLIVFCVIFFYHGEDADHAQSLKLTNSTVNKPQNAPVVITTTHKNLVWRTTTRRPTARSRVSKQPKFDLVKYLTLFDAVTKGELADVEALIQRGVPINEQNDFGETALHLAIKRGSDDIAKALIENGANANIQDNDGYSALALTLKNDRHNLTHIILDDVQFGIKSWNRDILGHKACNVSKKLADAFLQQGVDIKEDTKYAVRKAINDDDEIETKLVLEKCLGDIKGNNDIHPLFIAAEECKPKVAQMLIDNGIDINEVFGADWRTIHVAAHNGCKEIMQLLIDNHADLNETISLGYSPLCIATQDCRKEVAEMLRKAGAVMEPEYCIHRAC